MQQGLADWFYTGGPRPYGYAGLGEVFETGGMPDLSVFAEPYVAGPIVGLVVLGCLPIIIRTIRKREL